MPHVLACKNIYRLHVLFSAQRTRWTDRMCAFQHYISPNTTNGHLILSTTHRIMSSKHVDIFIKLQLFLKKTVPSVLEITDLVSCETYLSTYATRNCCNDIYSNQENSIETSLHLSVGHAWRHISQYQLQLSRTGKYVQIFKEMFSNGCVT